jgi:hypothetical protein
MEGTATGSPTAPRTVSPKGVGVTSNSRDQLRESMPMKSVLLAIPVIALVVGACGDDPAERSEGRYCTEVGDHLAALNAPVLSTQADIDAMLTEWRIVAGAAPIAIQAEWNSMIAAVETAATVDANDAVAVQRVADTARSSEPAANKVIDYTFTKCGATIGNVTPVVTVPVTAPPTTGG